MIDQSHIALESFIPGQWIKAGKQLSGACPFCGGKDRFYICTETNRWGCRQCSQGFNDPLAYVAKRDNLNLKNRADMQTALATLNLNQQVRTRSSGIDKPKNHVANAGSYSCFEPDYQSNLERFVYKCVWELESNHAVMQYLTDARRLDNRIVWAKEIGFNPSPGNMQWGNSEVYSYRGITIPWHGNRNIFRLRFRVNQPGAKYKQLAGAANYLYKPYPIFKNSVVVLVEGEFDALALISWLLRHHLRTGSKAYRHIVPVSTGGTTQGRVLRNVTELFMARRVLVAFDSDDNGAGDAAAQWWLSHLKNASRLLPDRHDVNDMVIHDCDMLKWIVGGLER